ncbi:MAG: cell division protein FtsK [Actinomycetia bacterium]|nr:cell division protein FtsK [Actinomycetes bacterium]
MPTPKGATAYIVPTLGQSLRQWQSAADPLGLALGVPSLAISGGSSGLIAVGLNVRDPLSTLLPMNVVPSSPNWDLWVGVDEAGHRAGLSTANASAVVVGGIPGSGKSQAVLGLFGQWGRRADVAFAVLDGKGGGDWEILRARSWAFEADVVGVAGLTQARDLLLDVHSVMQMRLKMLRQVTGVANFWTAFPQQSHPDIPLVVLVIDECQSVFDGRLHVDKEARRLCGECANLVEDLVKRGRSAGVLTVLATQKPTAESIPTGIRDNAGLRLAFGVKSRAAAEAVLGDEWSSDSGLSPVGAPVGVAIVGTGVAPLQRVRTPLYTSAAISDAYPQTLAAARPPDLSETYTARAQFGEK